MLLLQAILFTAISIQQLLCTVKAHSISFTQCDNKETAIVKSISISPDPLVPGKNVTFVVEGDVLRDIPKGTIGIKPPMLPVIRLPICGQAADLLDCPIKPGSWTHKATFPLPPIASVLGGRKIAVNVMASTPSANSVICVNIRGVAIARSKDPAQFGMEELLSSREYLQESATDHIFQPILFRPRVRPPAT